MLVSYNVKITIINTVTNTAASFDKTLESTIDVAAPAIYNNYFVLYDSVYVLDLFKQEIEDYCMVTGTTSDLIEIDEYEVVSLTEKTDVFFENPVDVNVFTLKPSIKCYVYPMEEALPVPTLIGEAFDSTTIIWTWPNDTAYAHYLIEEPIDVNDANNVNKIIAQLPIGKNNFVETGLEPNTQYSRRLVNYTDTQTSMPSAEATVTTETVTPSLSVEQYSEEKEYDFTTTIEDQEIISERLVAFHSGVGSGNDLKVYKQMDSDFYEKFKAYLQLTGRRIEREKRYDQVGFNYKVCLEATETVQEQEGEVTFRVSAYPKQKVSVSQYIWATYNFTVYVKVSAWITLYRSTAISGDKRIRIESDPIPFLFNKYVTPVYYDQDEERIVITPMPERSLSGVSVYDLLWNKVLTNEYYTGAYGGDPYNQNVELGYDYEFENTTIEDTYMYADEDIINSGDMTMFLEDNYSLMGTINVYTDKDANNNWLCTKTNYLKISGYTEAIIYEGTRYASAELNAYSYPMVTLFFQSESRNQLRNRMNHNVPFGGNMTDAFYINKVSNCGNLIQILGDGFTSDMIARITAGWTSPILNYRFNLEDPEAYTPYYEILPGCNPESMDYNMVIVEIYYCKNVAFNETVLNFDPSSAGMTKSSITYVYPNEMIDEYIRFVAQPMVKTRPYYDELPGKGFDSLYGLVNGRYREDNISGKQDLRVDTPQFNIPTTVTKYHSDSIRIYIRITEFYPDTALVSYTWDHEMTPGSGLTIVNGDYVTFSCDSLTYKNIEYIDVIGTYEIGEQELFDLKAKTLLYPLKRPNEVGSNIILKQNPYITESMPNGQSINDGLGDANGDSIWDAGEYIITYTGTGLTNVTHRAYIANGSIQTSANEILRTDTMVIFSITLVSSEHVTFDYIGIGAYLHSTKYELKASKYTNYFIKVTTNNDDVLASKYPTEVIFNSADETEIIPIDFKGMINSTSKWSPRVHNGFYYINQHEHYLYSEFNAVANFDKTSEVGYEEIDGYISFEVEMFRSGGSPQEYMITKDSISELLQDETLFTWVPQVNGSQSYGITIKPSIQGLEYKEYTTSTYYSPVILFPNEITTARRLVVDYVAADGTVGGIQLFVRSYDMENGNWSEWKPFTNNTIPDVPLSAGYQIKMDLSATVNNVTYEKEDYLACYLDWKDEIHEGMSTNIVTITDHLQAGPDEADAIFVSKIIDFSCESGLQLSMYTSSSKVQGYVSYSNVQDDLMIERTIWHPMASANLDMKFKYYRYKIVIPYGEKVYWVYKKYRTLKTTETLPYIRNINMGGYYEPANITANFVNVEAFSIPQDGLFHKVIDRIGDYITSDVIKRGFTMAEVSKITIKPTIANTYLLYDQTLPYNLLMDTYIEAATDEVITNVTKVSPFILTTNNVVEITGTPQQYAPIALEDEQGNTYTQLFSKQFSATNLTYTEVFDIEEPTKYIQLKSNNYDKDTLSIWINNDIIDLNNCQILNHLVIFSSELEKGTVVTVSYKILRSFYADIDRENNKTTLYLYSGTNIPMPAKVKVMFETSKKNNKMIASDLSLNPVYRTDYSGFIYLTHDQNIPYSIKIYCNPKRIQSGGKDSVDVQIEVLDMLNNPIIGKEIEIDCQYGIILCDSYVTDMNGIVHITYESSMLPSEDDVIVTCMINDYDKITQTVTITNY